jgi:hypothetical protein
MTRKVLNTSAHATRVKLVGQRPPKESVPTMEEGTKKHGNSLRLGVFIVVCAYFGYGLYFAVYGLRFGIGLISDSYVHNLISKGPLWWAVLYYGSEGLFDIIAGILRAGAGLFAAYSAFLYWRKKDTAIPQIKRKVGTALLLETGYYLSLIPAVIAAFAYYSSNEYLFYFDHTPGLILLIVTGLPCFAMIAVISPLLLKLRAKIVSDSPIQDVIKWGCLTSISYLYVVFWFNYSMSWAGSMVPYEGSRLQYGMTFLLEPANLASFIVTVFGLFAIATTALFFAVPGIKKQPSELILKRIGVVVTAFGGYFAFNILHFYLTGGYESHPSVWYEMVGPLHNPDLWCLAFIFMGLSMLFSGKFSLPSNR